MDQRQTERRIRAAIDTPRLTLADLGREAGISVASLKKYREGAHGMPPAAMRRLARFLAEHGREVERVAVELREAADALE